MTTNMKGVLVAFSFVLVLESIATEMALILLFSFMCARSELAKGFTQDYA